jgi:hypothetical protein
MLGSLVNHRVPYLLAAGVILVMIIVQTVAWWCWIQRRRVDVHADPQATSDRQERAISEPRPSGIAWQNTERTAP